MLVVCSAAINACRGDWQEVELRKGTSVADVISIDLYAPFDRSTLLGRPEVTYGEPRRFGTDKKGYFKEYVGQHGRIRIYEETYDDGEGWESAQWLEMYPGKMYLREVVRSPYLRKVDVANGEWKLSLVPADGSWYLTLGLDGETVTRVADLPPVE